MREVCYLFWAQCAVTFSIYVTVLLFGWLGGVMVRASVLRSSSCGFDSRSGRYQVTTLGKLFTPMCLCHQAVSFGTGHGAVTLYGWEGNCRSGVAPAMRHRRCALSTYELNGKGDEHPPMLPVDTAPFTLLLFSQAATAAAAMDISC